MIDYTFENIKNFQINDIKGIIKRAVSEVFKEVSFDKKYYLSILLTDNKGIKKINRKYRQVNQITNVLSFPYIENFDFNEKKKILLGDIAISLEKILTESQDQKKEFSEHLTHMTVHSVLHLFGFTHEKKKDFNVMKNKEISVLMRLSISSPYKNV
jgi:probable rRNA maturation factor|tara:strand:- start:2731 stop:3198 length:468 start_codon:yes stop_codon:yes gene_type:complete